MSNLLSRTCCLCSGTVAVAEHVENEVFQVGIGHRLHRYRWLPGLSRHAGNERRQTFASKDDFVLCRPSGNVGNAGDPPGVAGALHARQNTIQPVAFCAIPIAGLNALSDRS
jgi:hypothetical protein